MRKPIRVFCVN